LTNVAGSLTINSGAISGSTGDAFLVSGGTVTVIDAGTVSNVTGRHVNISGKTASGNVTFSGALSGTGTGVFLDNNDGAVVTFAGGMALSTGTNAAFTATNGGTVVATQNN